MSTTTRLATAADIDAIEDLVRQYREELGYEGRRRIPVPDGPQGVFNVLLAERDGEVVGMLVLQRCHDLARGTRFLLLSDIFVSPTGRRRGVARKLMHAVRDMAPELQCDGMSLMVSQVNVAALTTAAKAGFTSHDQLLFTYAEHSEDG